jgi:hypothetical protein
MRWNRRAMQRNGKLLRDALRAASRQEWTQRALAEADRHEAAFAVGMPGREAERRTRLAAWAEREGKSATELAAQDELDTVMGEAMTRRRMGLPPRTETERSLYREWAELDADVVADTAIAAQDARTHEYGPADFDAEEVGLDADDWHPGAIRDEAEFETEA